jgi:translation initiation factor IF-2
MQTISGLAKRLDMSAEEALATLHKLHFDIKTVDDEITDEQTDMLIDVDEDPAALDQFLADIKKKEEKARKRTERLQKAAKKAAAKRKAKAAAKKKKSAAKKKKPAAEEKTAAKEEIEEAEEGGEEKETAPVEPAGKTAPEKASEKVPEPEIVEIEAPGQPDEEAAAPPATTAEKAPEPEKAVTKKKVVAEILPDEEPPPETQKAPIIIGGAIEAEPAIELVRADGSHVGTLDADIEDRKAGEEEEEKVSGGALADAERRQEEIERQKRKKKAAKPLPVPDPDVVAEVKRKDEARKRQKEQEKRRKVKGKDEKLSPAEMMTSMQESAIRQPGSKEGGKRKRSGKTARKRQKRAERARAVEEKMREEAARTVREFQAGGKGTKKRRKRKGQGSDDGTEELSGGIIEVDETMTAEELSDAMEISVNDLILQLMDDNILITKNQSLEMELIRRLADEYGYEVRAVIPEEEEIMAEEPDDPETLKFRAPVVTVMGHVDHGKTSLLDVVREANVAEGEAGGITQHIAAYDVQTGHGRVVFLDTPGHEAFTQMRARGAQATDVVVLVVAADDGIKPQTIEAIDHAKAAEVPIVVAVNKCDKPNAQPDRVRQELTQYDLVAEEWGGKTIMKNISAKTREGIDDLIEMLVLESEMLELKANPDKQARGVVIESELTRGQGVVSWVLIQSGTLKTGDYFLAGEHYGRVRTMTTSRGKQVEAAGPSTPVAVTGFNGPPDAGDVFIVTGDERTARSVAEKREAYNRQKKGAAAKHMTLEDFHASMLAGERKVLHIIIKADVQGSVDVLESSLNKLGNQEVSVQIVHSGVGGINESDVLLASASDAVIIGFHVTANARIQKLAEQEGVDVRTYRVIYEAIDEVRHALEGMLAPEQREVIMGHAEIRQVFRSSSLGNIAGCYQVDGETERGAPARLVRDDVVIYTGRIDSIRREKEDVRSVAIGFECGIKLAGYDDIKEGDTIETYRMEEVAKTLE